MAITGSPESGPTKVGVAVSDLFAGCFALAGILALLLEREQTGRGGHVEADLFSSTLAALINVAQTALVTGAEAKQFGNAHPQIVPYRPFHASDGEFIVAAGTDRQFARLCSIVGRDAWAEDPSFRTNAGRVENREAIERGFEESFRGPTARPLDRGLPRGGSPGGAGAGAARGAPIRGSRKSRGGRHRRGVRFVASPIRVEDRTPPLRFPPKLDEHGEALRREFGLPSPVVIPRSASDEGTER